MVKEHFNTKNLQQIINTKKTSGIITEIEVIEQDYVDFKIKEYLIHFENDTDNLVFKTDAYLYDKETGGALKYNELKVGDVIEIEYKDDLKSENITIISLIDPKVEKSLLGVIIVTNGKEYQTIEDIPDFFGEHGLQYFTYNNGSSTNISFGDTKMKMTRNGNYVDYDIELTISLDRYKIINKVAIGLVYSTGIEYVEEIDIFYDNNYEYKQRIYRGEIESFYYGKKNPYSVHTQDVSYTVKFIETNSFWSIDIYEYGIDHNLIKTTTIVNSDDFYDFEADDNAIYSYINVTYFTGSKYIRKVFQLNIGEEIDIQLSDDYGLVYKNKFLYHSIPNLPFPT